MLRCLNKCFAEIKCWGYDNGHICEAEASVLHSYHMLPHIDALDPTKRVLAIYQYLEIWGNKFQYHRHFDLTKLICQMYMI